MAQTGSLTLGSIENPNRSVFRGVADRVWAASRPKLERLVYANGGLGDELMLTAIARCARAGGQPIHVLTDSPQLWRENADAATIQTGIEKWQYALRRGWISTSILHLAYDSHRADRHIAQQMADHLGLELPPDWRPVFPPLPHPMTLRSKRIVIQNSCRGARYSSPTKEWPQSQWEALVPQLGGFELVQLGTAQDPTLPGVIDRRGQTSLDDAAEIITASSCFLGLESGLMHVAAAVGTPAVIIYGGRTRPSQTGYPFHRHLTREPPCVGCALHTGCSHDMICMEIPVAEVLAAVRSVLA